MTESVDHILKSSLLLDIETLGDNQIVKIGGICRNHIVEKKGNFKAIEALLELDKIASEANFVLGHNLLGHDLPILQAFSPQLQLLQKPVIDTLYLSPLAFPENPYHRLVKDYKLVRSSLNDPVADARLAGEIFVDQWQAFESLPPSKREILSFYRYCFEGSAVESLTGDGIASVFSALKAEEIDENRAFDIFQRQTAGKACETGVVMSANRHLLNPARRADLAYCLAWLQVAGNNSVIPPWVRHRFPDIVPLLRVLRDIPCGNSGCQYCQEMHNPKAQLSKYFGFDDFRKQPKTADGRSLQEAIIFSGLSDKPLLAILPTGGGKSLCFQLPALVRHARRGVLTVVVSPLQALMKDQVDNLQRLTGATSAGALYGMLTPPERGDVLERVRLGDIGILYVSPEQLRNLSFRATILQREIGCWVFDEAHCLSKWGHDFRPDYLYASRFIREFAAEQRTPIPPIVCFTATAKRDVREEIIDHFQRELGQELALFEGGVERDNLLFLAQMAEKAEKGERIHEILQSHFKTPADGAAVIFCATRAKAEFYEEFLSKKEWTVAAFHAGLEAPAKREIQERFIGGDLQVICATNAFGMGIDKDNVRLVIHADIPGSLENYLQEAGRAGRDRLPAECILLYSEQDIETQFRLGALSELSRHDISQILRGIRKARQNKNHEIVLTTGDLIRDDSVEISFDKEDSLADTKIKTAVSWLERAGFVERNHNRTSVYQGLPLVKDLMEARAKMARLNLSQKQRERWLDVLTALFNAKVNEGMSADELAELPSFKPTAAEEDAGIEASQLVLRALHDMTEAGLLKQGLQLTAYVRYKVADSSRARFEKLCSLEESMLKILQEEDPDPEGWVSLTLRKLNQRLIDEGHSCIPAMLKNLLKSLARDGKGLAGKRGSIEMRSIGVDHVRVKLQRDWPSLIETASRRREVARTALEAIHGKIPDNAPASKDSLVAFSVDDIAEAIRSDFFLAGKLTDVLAAIDRALMFLHEQDVIQLQQGLGIFRQAMTIKVVEQDKRRGYQKKDYEPLALHYKERVFQVHVMNEYALLALKNVQQALNFVLAYFTLDRQTFLRRYFASRKEELERATSAESYRQIVESLGNQVQAGIVAAPPDENILILAGPGSGKTRTVVHRCAYLLRVERVPARSILVLCFNRNAAIELRRRLVGLAGDDAKGVIVQTYHGLAMRLCGLSFSEAVQRQKIDENIFDQLIVKATRLLKGELDLPGLASDEIRDRLLEGFRFILVDEYQDIDEAQYNLISALAGRTQTEADSKLAIMAVGDDDQNIYASFRHTNIKFIKQFEDDYQAQKYHLIENYRSTAHIIAAANGLIAHNRERMKIAHPIVVNYGRRLLPPGGDWEHLDRIAKGKVQLCSVPDAGMQAVAVIAEIQRLKQCNPSLEWDKVAVLARNHDELEPIRTHLEAQKIPVCWTYDSKKLPPIFRVREILTFLDVLREQRQQLATADSLSKLLTDTEAGNPWQALLRNLLSAWQLESNNAELPVDMALEFICDSLMEYRRDPSRGHGIYLGTVHGAKGLEFSHVLILGGGWLSMRAGDRQEEERRVYYVAMTRAKETLCLFERQDAAHPHVALLSGDFLFKRDIQELTPPDPELMARRYAILGMRDINLGYAGRKEANSAVHKCLAGLRHGDTLELNTLGERVILQDQHGTCVARLSETASKEWQERLPDVESARVLALIEWRKDDGEAEYSRMCQVDKWEVPLVEVIYRARSTHEGGG